MPAPSHLPRGHVTFLFTDVEHSTRITEELTDERYRLHLRDPHRTRLLAAAERNGGHEIHRVGDGHLFVFQKADDALSCAVEFQQSLAQEPITDDKYTLRVRMGLHTSTKEREPHPIKDGFFEYPGEDTNYAARIGGLGAGGQIIFSAETHRVATAAKELRLLIGGQDLPLHPWPNRYIKSFQAGPQTVYEVLYAEGQQPREPGARFLPPFYTGERNRYIAREHKESQVLEEFADPQNHDGTTARLVTIHAEGGMGKTRLSIACALQMIGVFEHGAYLVPLENIGRGLEAAEAETQTPPEAAKSGKMLESAVAEAIGRELGLSGAAAQPESLLQYLSDRELLLILDNYESVVCDEVGMYLCDLVTETRGVHILATGRHPVGASDIEKIVTLDDGMTETEARALFLERAALKWPKGRTLTSEEDAQLARILHLASINPEAASQSERGGSIPLAVELAAAWVGHRALREIADGLEGTALGEPTKAPPGGFRSNDKRSHARQSSLERSLAWSYNLIGQTADASAQRTFAAASLFAATFDAATLMVICGSHARRDLDALHNASLVRRIEVDGTSRYYLHRFTREYATARFEGLPDADDTRRRFLAHYVTVAQKASDLNDATNRDTLDQEWRNVLAASNIALE